MIIISNYTNRIGPDFFVNLRREHPALLGKANSFENYEEDLFPIYYYKFITVAGTYYAPPREVVATMLASEWTLDLSLTFGSASLSESGKLLKYSQDGDEGDNNPDDDIKTINDKMNKYSGFALTTFSDSDNSGEDSISFSIDIGSLDVIMWDWTLKKWTVPITMSIYCSNSPEGEGEVTSGSFGLGNRTIPFGSALSSVPINLFGNQYYAYEMQGGSTAFPTGSITLTAVKYLPLAVPP